MVRKCRVFCVIFMNGLFQYQISTMLKIGIPMMVKSLDNHKIMMENTFVSFAETINIMILKLLKVVAFAIGKIVLIFIIQINLNRGKSIVLRITFR